MMESRKDFLECPCFFREEKFSIYLAKRGAQTLEVSKKRQGKESA